MATSREIARDALVALLTTALVGVGLPVKTVAGDKQKTLLGVTPLVTVLSAGTARPGMTRQGSSTRFLFSVQVWVLQEKVGSWTLAQAEDALDDIEARITQVYQDNKVNIGVWDCLMYAGDTVVREASVEGIPHYVELYPTSIVLARA